MATEIAALGALLPLGAALQAAPQVEGVVLDADGEPGRVLIQRPVTVRAGQTFVLSTTRSYDGRRLQEPRKVRVLFDAAAGASLTVGAGARLVVEGTVQVPVEWVATPTDPPVRPLMTLAAGGRGELGHAALTNVGLHVEGAGHRLEHVSVQYAGDHPAFAFAGASGRFRDLFAHHCTWGFSFEPLDGKPCDLSIAEGCIRSCAKGGPGAMYGSGGALRSLPAPEGAKHRVRFTRVDWDPSWDALQGIELAASGARPRIVAIGDSIVQGSDRYVNFWDYFAGNDDIEHAWPYVLQQRVPGFFVVNKGEGGDTTGGMLGRLADITDEVKPAYCFLGGGTNDLGGGAPEKVVANFREMWRRLRAAAIVPVQLAITPYSRPDDRETRVIETDRLLREACAAEKVHFADTYTLLLDDSGRGLKKVYDGGDGLHVSRAGYQRMGEFLADEFQRHVLRRREE